MFGFHPKDRGFEPRQERKLLYPLRRGSEENEALLVFCSFFRLLDIEVLKEENEVRTRRVNLDNLRYSECKAYLYHLHGSIFPSGRGAERHAVGTSQIS